jgi:predicted anti-sigma-YlaC factor YlaD
MKCQKIIALLTEYYDNALSQKTSSKVKEHLNQCEDCKKKFEEFDKGLIILKRLKPIE